MMVPEARGADSALRLPGGRPRKGGADRFFSDYFAAIIPHPAGDMVHYLQYFYGRHGIC